MRYHHTQHAPLYLTLVAAGGAMFLSAWFIPDQAPQMILAATGGLMFLLAASFRRLTVRDEGDHLLIEFGPLPLFRRRIRYADIEHAERGRTSWIDGWGIHLSPRGGWTWNLWGYDCVHVQLTRGRKLHIGTDEPAALEAFLRGRAGGGAQDLAT